MDALPASGPKKINNTSVGWRKHPEMKSRRFYPPFWTKMCCGFKGTTWLGWKTYPSLNSIE